MRATDIAKDKRWTKLETDSLGSTSIFQSDFGALAAKQWLGILHI